MKSQLLLLVAILCALLTRDGFAQPNTANNATMSAGVGPDGNGSIVVEAHGVQPKAPLFFSATVDNEVHVGAGAITGEMKIQLKIMQGHPEVLTLGLAGSGDV